MESSIGERLVELISPIIDVSYMQAEVDKFPYCAYDIESEAPLRDKHKIYGSKAEVSIYVVATTESKASEICNKIKKKLTRGPQWDFVLETTSASTDSEHWAYRMEYTIKQIFE